VKIDFYDFGEIIVAGEQYSSDVIIYPEKVSSSWWRKEGHSVSIEDIQDVVSKKPKIIVIGTGYSGCMVVPEKTREYIEKQNINLIVQETREAVETHNKLYPNHVITCLHLTC